MTIKNIIGWAIIALLFAVATAFLCWVYGWKGIAFIYGGSAVFGGALFVAVYLISDEE